jgi:hypothetical protein
MFSEAPVRFAAMLPVLEAMLAGVAVGIINRLLARLEVQCPEDVREQMRDDSSSSTASSGTVEIPHFH